MSAINKVLDRTEYRVKRLHGLEQAVWIYDLGIETVLDIGANTGQFADSIRKVLPDARICSFEPIEECYRELSRRMNTDQRFENFPYALGSEDGSTVLNKNDFAPSSSLLPMTETHIAEFPFTAKTSVTEIKVRRLDSVSPGLELRTPLLVKMDVQGFELHVIEGGRETLAQAAVVIVEVLFVEFYKGQPFFDDLYTELRKLGFRFSGVLEQSHSSRNGRPLYCDTLFVR